MEFESRETLMMEEREELMVPPGGGIPTFRPAHFLQPTFSPTDEKNQSFPFPFSSNAISDPQSEGEKLNVVFPGWKRLTRLAQKEWVRWVHKLQPVYGEIWKKAGIFDAILASKCNILKRKGSKNLMAALAEKWCPETNTFLFPWGESTVTLEDVKVLGGLPVLGRPAWNPMKSDEMRRLQAKLNDVHLNISRNTQQAARESTWMDHFDGVGEEGLEHEAFLVLWLSRYIFPNRNGRIPKNLFLIAINLSRGIPVALAPSVLASIYSDLSSMKKASLMDSQNLCSPFGLVQVWVWERFPKLSPKPNPMKLGEPRLSRWHEVNPLDMEFEEISEMLDSSGEDFLWRPYARMLTNWDAKKLYCETEMYVMAGSDMDSEAIQVWVRCWRHSELLRIDSFCVEKYLPHRVGMQFGFDQDIPGPVDRVHGRRAAWCHFNRPVGDAKVYLPARLFESDITKRYEEEWNRAHQMQEMRCVAYDATVSSQEGEENGVEDDSEPEIMEISGCASDDVSVSSQEGEENGDEDDSDPEMMEIAEYVDDHSGPEKMELLGCASDGVFVSSQEGEENGDEDASEPEMMKILGCASDVSVSSLVGEENGDEDDSDPEVMEIPGFVDDHSGPEKMETPGCVDDHSEPEKVEILNCVGDHSEPKKMLEIPGSVEDRIEKSSSVKNVDVIPVKEKSRSPEEHGLDTVNCRPVSSSTRSSSPYSIEEVQAMVSNLEKVWAEIKAKQREPVAK